MMSGADHRHLPVDLGRYNLRGDVMKTMNTGMLSPYTFMALVVALAVAGQGCGGATPVGPDSGSKTHP